MPLAPMASNSRAISITCVVLLPPAPAITGTRPRASSSVISTTRFCSALVSVGLSPVVPQGTKKLMPASTWRRTSRRSASSSNEKSGRNGVTSAVPHPVNICRLLRPAVLLDFLHDISKIKKSFFAHDPSRRAQRPSRKSRPDARPRGCCRYRSAFRNPLSSYDRQALIGCPMAHLFSWRGEFPMPMRHIPAAGQTSARHQPPRARTSSRLPKNLRSIQGLFLHVLPPRALAPVDQTSPLCRPRYLPLTSPAALCFRSPMPEWKTQSPRRCRENSQESALQNGRCFRRRGAASPFRRS